ncbi:MAG: DUF1015 domain-containing protein [Oligoflexia bacterium]|nr:DUF1015 domain-containing protein [Oligoflexia bacterium]
MAVVKPFKAWRYNLSNKVKDLSRVVVPPYDVITPEELKEMKALSQFNFSQVILAEGENKHKKAAEFFLNLQSQEVLIRDNTPCFYFYKQDFSLSNYEQFCQDVDKNLSRYGFFAVVQVEDYKNKVVLPHEKTFAKYKQDRYELMTQAQGNMEPVFLGYDSSDFTDSEFEQIVSDLKPLYDYTDRYKVHHTLWGVDNKVIIEKVEAKLKNQKLYILDGHHRYETALKFYQDNPQENTKYVLANVCAFKQKGTVILPTHRLLKFNSANEKALFNKRCEEFFTLENVDSLSQLEEKLKLESAVAFGIKFSGNKGYLFAKLKDKKGAKKSVDFLDLDFLHESFLKEEFKPYYVRSIPEFDQLLKENKYDVGFLVRPNTYDDVVGKALHQKVMPHKSTFFFPKIPSGLVVHSFK